jgi:hypothetical protein
MGDGFERDLAAAVAASLADQSAAEGGNPSASGGADSVTAGAAEPEPEEGVDVVAAAFGRLEVSVSVRAAGPRVRAAAVCAPPVAVAARVSELRYYAVWGPADRVPPGIYVGRGTSAYSHLVGLVGFSALRWKRQASLDLAVEEYTLRTASIRASRPLPPRVFEH